MPLPGIVDKLFFQTMTRDKDVSGAGARVNIKLSNGQTYEANIAATPKATDEQIKTRALGSLARQGNKVAAADLAAMESAAATPKLGIGGRATVRGMGALGLTGMVADVFVAEKDAKDPKKVEAYAQQIRDGQMRLTDLPPFSELAKKVAAELQKGPSC